VVLVHLNVGSKLQATMFQVVNTLTSDKRARAERVGNAMARRETIEPEDAGICHFTTRRLGMRVDTSGTLLYSADVSFDVTNMLVIGCAVERNTDT
jgi:hypothetical protein